MISKEAAEKVALLYNKLQDIIQDSNRKTLRPLTEDEFNIWFDDDKLGYNYGLRCYFKYLYQKDLNSPVEERFEEVEVMPWTLKKIVSETGSSYHYEIENKGKLISVYSTDNRVEKPFVYPFGKEFERIGLYCNDKCEYIHGHYRNPMFEIRKWKKKKWGY